MTTGEPVCPWAHPSNTVEGPVMAARARHVLSAALVLAAAFVGDISDAHQSSSTLGTIRARGHVLCGVGDGLAGYSSASAQGVWSGIGADFCRALAVAVLDNKAAVQFRALPEPQQVEALQAGEVDVLARHADIPSGDDAVQGIRMAGVLVYDGQGFLVRRSEHIASALELSGVRVCVTREGSAAHRVTGYFSALRMPLELVRFDRWTDAVTAFDSGGCLVLSAGLPELALARQGLARPGEHDILPELAFKEPVGPAVRDGDDEWLSVVRWTLYALIAAEQLGVTSATVDAAKHSGSAEVRRFLGIDTDLGARIGLSPDWTQRVIRQVGNYGELFERHLGARSPLKLERRLNNLSSKGGLHYAPSF
jgi:general L-amino acid transport system substrate-binding protein